MDAVALPHVCDCSFILRGALLWHLANYVDVTTLSFCAFRAASAKCQTSKRTSFGPIHDRFKLIKAQGRLNVLRTSMKFTT